MYRLTDPAIHTDANTYRTSLTDMGRVGIDMVMSAHLCNDYCAMLRLSEHRPSAANVLGPIPDHHTIYAP